MPVPQGMSRGSADSILMEMYPEKQVFSQINLQHKVLKRFRRRKWSIAEGNRFLVNIRTAYGDGGGERQEWDRVPEPDVDDHEWAMFNYKRYDEVVRLSGEILTSGGSIVDPLSNEMTSLVERSQLKLERALFLPSLNRLGTITAHTAGTAVVTVDSHQYFQRRERCDILTTAGALGQGTQNNRLLTVVQNTDGTGTLTFETAFTGSVVGYEIFRTQTRNKNIFGLPDIVSTSNPVSGVNYGSIDRSSITEWQAHEEDAGGASLSAQLIATAVTECELKSDFKPNVAWMHPYVHNDLLKVVQADRRYGGTVKEFETWGSTVMVDGMPCLRSRHVPFDKVYLLHEPSFRIAHPPNMADGQWAKSGWTGGQQLQSMLGAGYWGWQALYVRRWQLICTNPNRNALIKNVAWSRTGTV